MIRAIFAAVLLVTLVSAGPGEYKKKIFMKYAMNNMFAKCIGQQAMDKFVLDYIKAAQRCYPREFNVTLKPVYIRPYPVEGYNNYNNRGNFQQNYNNQPFQQYQQQQYQQFQQPQYQQFQQQPQYNQQYRQPQFQGQQYRQPQQNFGNQQPQPFYAPGVGFQPVNNNQVLNRQVRQANKKNNKNQNNKQKQVVAGTNAQGEGEAELYYYNKLKDHMTGKVGNFSCIMHEMGYFTEDNQVNIAKYKQAYNELTTIPAAMREEFIEAIDLCQEVSECLPEKCFAKYPYGPEYGRSFFFVMCEKKKALEVCLKKQMIDDYYKYKDIIGEDQIHDDLENTEDMFGMGF
jgi:hypothetical protein